MCYRLTQKQMIASTMAFGIMALSLFFFVRAAFLDDRYQAEVAFGLMIGIFVVIFDFAKCIRESIPKFLKPAAVLAVLFVISVVSFAFSHGFFYAHWILETIFFIGVTVVQIMLSYHASIKGYKVI